MWPLARVDAHVTMQFTAVLETTSAVRATVRLLLGVNAAVDAQVLLDRKRFSAHLAHKWTFSCRAFKKPRLI